MELTKDIKKSCLTCSNANLRAHSCVLTGEQIVLRKFQYTVCELYTKSNRKEPVEYKHEEWSPDCDQEWVKYLHD